MTNKERRDAGLAYVADSEILKEIGEAKQRLDRLNAIDSWKFDEIAKALSELIEDSHDALVFLPFYCEYGTHISLGRNFFANSGCFMLDVAKITIGDNCMLGPRVSLYTAGHPIHPETRATAYEYGKPITIGDNVWIGGGVTVLPGVTIGNGAVIGAGSVVTRDIPEMSIAAGNPCRVIRKITEADRRTLYRNEQIDDEVWQSIINQELDEI